MEIQSFYDLPGTETWSADMWIYLGFVFTPPQIPASVTCKFEGMLV